MCLRQVSKFQKTVIIVILYTLLYVFVTVSKTPIYSFVSDDMRIGNKYALIYLIAKAPVFTDINGADVFKKRKCGNCFLTNNKGFLPLRDYDAVVVFRDEDPSVFTEPDKIYYIETSEDCVKKKLIGCDVKVISYSSREEHDLCGFCRELNLKRS